MPSQSSKGSSLVVFWSVKGGSGTSVVSVLYALARSGSGGATTLIDLAGDAPSILGLGKGRSLGANQWLAAGREVGPEALARLGEPVNEALTIVRSGSCESIDAITAAEAATRLRFACRDSDTVVDAGTLRHDKEVGAFIADHADTSILVTRPCYLAVSRASNFAIKPSAVVVVDEPNRSLDARDIQEVLGVPVVATIAWDPKLARAVDAGRVGGSRFVLPKAIVTLAENADSFEAQRVG